MSKPTPEALAAAQALRLTDTFGIAHEEAMVIDRITRLPELLAVVAALDELIECADLRGDADLPHPCDDPKLWTARMQTAWDEARAALDAAQEETDGD